MTTYARIVGGHAIDITSIDPALIYHADIAPEFIVVPDGTKTGATKSGATWTAPPPAPPAPEARLEMLTPMTFYLAFTPAERIAIKSSTNAMVQEFWATYELAVKLDKPIDPNLNSVKDGLAYLAAPAPGVAILDSADRIPAILAGIAQ